MVKSRSVKRNAKNARGLERDRVAIFLAATAPFPESRASYFRFARFNTSAPYYLRDWHRLYFLLFYILLSITRFSDSLSIPKFRAIRFSRVIYHLTPLLNHATKINMFTKEIGNYFRQPSNFVCLKICLLISCHKLPEMHTERQVRCPCSMRCSLVSLYVHVCTNSRVQAKRFSADMFFRLKIWCLN